MRTWVVAGTVLSLACAADSTRQAWVQCEPQLVRASASPFDWVEVTGLPQELESPVAEVGASDGSAAVLATVTERRDGSVWLRVPVHPSFQIGGGAATVSISSETFSCTPVPLAIDPMEPVPGTMAVAKDELRKAFDEILAPIGTEPITTERLAAELAELGASGGGVPLVAIPALWALPEMERLERLIAGDSIGASSPADAEVLDAVAWRLELPQRMREFRAVVRVANELIGSIEVAVPPAGEAMAHVDPGSTAPFRFASRAPEPLPSSLAPRTTERPPAASECPTGRNNIFQIGEPAKLDDLMRVQDYAERFLAGAKDQQGGSAAGTLFGDLGIFAGWLKYAGKPGAAASSVWDSFSTIVLNTGEAYTSLLPGDMVLTVAADPTEFEEDSEETGTWTARSVATSQGMKLTQKVIERVMETALEKGLADASIGKELTEDDGLAGEVDKRLIEEPTKAALDALLDAIGAKEVEGGFDIPGGCWSQSDMSASDEPGGGGTGGNSAPPPLVTGHLSGGAVQFTANGGGATREYEPVAAGTSRLEVRTVAGYRKSMEAVVGQLGSVGLTTPVATTYAFGGDQYTAVTRITVNEIEVNLNPMIIRVDPGERVPFVATVENAVDTRVRWSSSADPLDEIVDFGEGTHEAMLIAPLDPKVYPITIEVESMSRRGARASGLPVRKATAQVQLADPVIDIRPIGGCFAPGSKRQFTAQVFGVEAQEVRWSRRGVGDIDAGGHFRAGRREGSATIRAAWAVDPDVSSEVEVRVEEECRYFEFRVAGEVHGTQNGEPGIYGVYCDGPCPSIMQRLGHCTVGLRFLGESLMPALELTALIPGGLERRDYAFGNWAASKTWGNENRTPGTFYAHLGTGKSDSSEMGTPRFKSRGGTLSITHIDDDRIEGSFHIDVKEEGPFEPSLDYKQRSATVTGMFAAPLERRIGSPNFYECSEVSK